LAWHIDQNSLHGTGLVSIQGMLVLTDMGGATGGTAFIRKSHLKHVGVMKRNCSADDSESEWDFVPIEDDDPVLRNPRNMVQPFVKAGSVLLWDSRTVHRVLPPTDLSTERVVSYLSMAPREMLKESVAKLRRNAYTKGISTTHWCTKFVDRGEKRIPPKLPYSRADPKIRALIS
jgi:ectoine hydroxylase-related dioxygenase (phytanoyl-CoA dioxygenase family)